MARRISKPFLLLLLTAAGAVAAATAFVQILPLASMPVIATPAGIDKMHLLDEEHAMMRVFLAEQDARARLAAAVESEPEPDPPIAASKYPPAKPLRMVKAPAHPPLAILPPPAIAVAQTPPPAEPPRMQQGWVQEATQLPRRLWAVVGELLDERAPPIPPRPIPPV